MNVPNNFRKPILGALGIALWLVTWQWFTTSGPLAGVSGLPTASETLSTSLQLLTQGIFWNAILDTLWMTGLGLLIALILGLSLGVAMGLSRPIFTLLDPMFQFLRPIPPVVLLPIVLLVLGPTPQLGIVLAAFTAFWPILIQTMVGVKSVDPIALENARAMILTKRLVQTRIVLPSAVPSIATGVRIAGSAALMLAVGVGLLGGAPGLGRLILVAQQAGQGTLVFGIIIWSGVLGLLISALLSSLEEALTRGHRPTGVES